MLNGGVTGTERGVNYMHRLLDLGAGAYIDRLAFHPYVSNDGLDTHVYPDIIWPLISGVQQRAGKPLWMTEYGWSSGCGDGAVACSEEVQANRIARHTVMLFKIGQVERVFYFLVKDPGDRTDFYGLTHADARTKPAFTAFRPSRPTGRHAVRYACRARCGHLGHALLWLGSDRRCHLVAIWRS